MRKNNQVKTGWNLGAVEQILYNVLKNNPRLSVNDIEQIAEISKLPEVEVSVGIQLLKHKKLI